MRHKDTEPQPCFNTNATNSINVSLFGLEETLEKKVFVSEKVLLE